MKRVHRRSVTGGIQGNGEGGGSGRREPAVDGSRKETADRVAKYQTDMVGRTYLRYSYRCGCLGCAFVVLRVSCPFFSLLVVLCLCMFF